MKFLSLYPSTYVEAMKNAADIPRPARWAALLFLAYGLVVIGAALLWTMEGWVGAAIRGGALVTIALGLWKGARWGWILGVVFPGIWLLRGLIALGRLAADALGDGPAPPALATSLLVFAVLLLGLGWALLLLRPVRTAYLEDGPR